MSPFGCCARAVAHAALTGSSAVSVTQAQAVIAAAILRQLHAVVTTGQRWDPVIATHSTQHNTRIRIAA